MASVEKITGAGNPEPTTYDRVRHESMKLRPIGYGFFPVNRTIDIPICGLCKQECPNPVRFHNGKPYHQECYKTL